MLLQRLAAPEVASVAASLAGGRAANLAASAWRRALTEATPGLSLVGDVEILNVDPEDLVGACNGLVKHPSEVCSRIGISRRRHRRSRLALGSERVLS
jgi:hypothetical protein